MAGHYVATEWRWVETNEGATWTLFLLKHCPTQAGHAFTFPVTVQLVKDKCVVT